MTRIEKSRQAHHDPGRNAWKCRQTGTAIKHTALGQLVLTRGAMAEKDKFGAFKVCVASHERTPQPLLCPQINNISRYLEHSNRGSWGDDVVTSRFHVCTIERRHETKGGQCVVATMLSSAHRHREILRLSRDLALDKSESLLPVFTSIALVRSSVVSVTAVRVSGVAIRLDLGGTGARKAGGTGIELWEQESQQNEETRNGRSCSPLQPCKCQPHKEDRRRSAGRP